MRKIALSIILISILALSTVLTLAQQDTPIEIGQTVTGTITNEDPVDTYILTGQVGQKVAISMSATDQGLDSYVRLVAPDGQEFFNDDSGQTLNSMLIVTLPVDGQYTLNATRCCDTNSPSGSVGAYELRVQTITPINLTFGQPLTVELNDNQPYAFITVNNVPSGRMSMFAERTAGDAGLIIEMRDASGMVLNSAVQTPDGRVAFDPFIVPVNANGQVLLVAYRQMNYGGVVAGTAVSATITTSAIEATPITLGQTISGVLNDGNVADYYVFTGSNSEILRLEGSNTESFGVDDVLQMLGNNPDGEQPFEVAIYGSNGYMMMGGNTGYGPEPSKFLIDPLQLPETGEYLMIVRRLSMDGTSPLGTSHYSVTLSATSTPMIELGVAIVDGFQPNQWERVYRLEGTTGQTIRITLSSESGASYGPSLNVQGPSTGNPNMPTPDGMGYAFYLSGNSSTDAILTYEVTLPQDGVYLFRISDSSYNPDGQPDGSFRLLVEDVNN